jgi:hypothetical protein
VILVTGYRRQFDENGNIGRLVRESFQPAGGINVAGQVLDISKHENTIRAIAFTERAGRSARLYRFPSREQATLPCAPAARRRPSELRIHLAVEITIGLMFWLIWFIWRLTH